MTDDLDERLKKTREFFDKADYAYAFTVADALIDTRARLAVLEAYHKTASVRDNGACEAPVSDKSLPHPQGGVEVTYEMARAARAAFNESSGPSIQDDWRTALTAAFALIPKAPQIPVQGEPVAWIVRHPDAMAMLFEDQAEMEQFARSFSPVEVQPVYASPPPPVAAPGVEEKIAQILVELSMGETSVASAQGAIFALLHPAASERDPAQGSLNSGEGV
jgi:hypothetical protein